MYPYPSQSIGADGARMSAEAYQQYYQRQPERAYPASTQPQAQPQPQAQQNTTSQYYQGQFAPYYYQVPVTNPDGTAVPGQDRYQAANLYQTYGQGYSHPTTAANTATAAATATAPAAPAAPGAATATRPAYQYAPYSNDMMMSMLYPASQSATTQQPQTGGATAGPQQPSNVQQISQNGQMQPQMNQLGAPRAYPPRNQYQAVPQQNHMVTATSPGIRRPPVSPTANQRAIVNTHISAIPMGMPITDPTGQTAPPGIKPRVTTTLWEDEGTTCFQVDARGFCVARREDNDMINGTKLLNVAGMTRGRRDGLLKGERNRHVVKAGAMHLKGVWIPYDRALDFANRERIVDLLYPLFVSDIKAVLYHPGSDARLRGGALDTAASQSVPSRSLTSNNNMIVSSQQGGGAGANVKTEAGLPESMASNTGLSQIQPLQQGAQGAQSGQSGQSGQGAQGIQGTQGAAQGAAQGTQAALAQAQAQGTQGTPNSQSNSSGSSGGSQSQLQIPSAQQPQMQLQMSQQVPQVQQLQQQVSQIQQVPQQQVTQIPQQLQQMSQIPQVPHLQQMSQIPQLQQIPQIHQGHQVHQDIQPQQQQQSQPQAQQQNQPQSNTQSQQTQSQSQGQTQGQLTQSQLAQLQQVAQSNNGQPLQQGMQTHSPYQQSMQQNGMSQEQHDQSDTQTNSENNENLRQLDGRSDQYELPHTDQRKQDSDSEVKKSPQHTPQHTSSENFGYGAQHEASNSESAAPVYYSNQQMGYKS